MRVSPPCAVILGRGRTHRDDLAGLDEHLQHAALQCDGHEYVYHVIGPVDGINNQTSMSSVLIRVIPRRIRFARAEQPAERGDDADVARERGPARGIERGVVQFVRDDRRDEMQPELDLGQDEARRERGEREREEGECHDQRRVHYTGAVSSGGGRISGGTDGSGRR